MKPKKLKDLKEIDKRQIRGVAIKERNWCEIYGLSQTQLQQAYLFQYNPFPYFYIATYAPFIIESNAELITCSRGAQEAK